MDETESPADRPTADPITAVVADRVRRLRSAAGMSQAQLANAISAAGTRWTRATVGNLERRSSASRATGAESGRDSVSVQELLALAVALNVPPIWLLADPTARDAVPVADGVEPDPWSALLWMAGKADTAGDWRYSQEPLSAVYQVVEIVAVFRRMRSHRLTAAALLEDPGHDDEALNLGERLRLNALQVPLEYLVEHGYQLPTLPADLIERVRELGVTLPGLEA